MQFIQRIYNSLYPLFYERSEENRGIYLAEHSSGTYFWKSGATASEEANLVIHKDELTLAISSTKVEIKTEISKIQWRKNQHFYTTNVFTQVNCKVCRQRRFATKLYISKFTSAKNRGKLLRQNKVKDWVSNNIYWKRASYTQQNRGIHAKNAYFQYKHLNKTAEKSGLQIDIAEKTNRIFTNLDLLSLVFYICISTQKGEYKTKLHALRFSISHHLADFDFEIWCMSPHFVFVNSPREKARFTANQSKIAPTSPPPSPRT